MQLQDAFSRYVKELVLSQFTTKRYNFAFGALLIGMEDTGQIEAVIMKPCECPELHSDLTNLVMALQEIRVQGPEQPEGDRLGIYGEGTCVKFHRLFITTLLSYGKHLEALQHINRMDGRDHAQKYKQVWIFSFLLWWIMSSHMFHHHINVLRRGMFLTIPCGHKELVDQYNDYTSFTSWGCQDITKAECNGNWGDNTNQVVLQEY